MLSEELASSIPASFAATLGDSLLELLAPWWVEACFLIAFPLGYFILNFDSTGKHGAKVVKKQPVAPRSSAVDPRAEHLLRGLEKDLAAGDAAKAAERWRESCGSTAGTAETLRLAVQALAGIGAESLVEEVAKHMEAHAKQLCTTKCALMVLDAVGHGKYPVLLDQLSLMCRERLRIPVTYQWYEELLGGHAFAGDEARVDELCEEVAAMGQKLTARGYALVIKGFLCKGMLDTAVKHMKAMVVQGFYVPPFAVTLLFKVASSNARVEEMFELCHDEGIPLPDDATGVIFEDCCRRADLTLASRIDALIRQSNHGRLPLAASDSLLKIYIAATDPRALDLWREITSSGQWLSDALFVSILSRSADVKYLRFAEEVAQWARSHQRMTLQGYSALMKVYACCGLHGRACDLYPQLCQEGLVPDSIMYGCLMNFAAECGRTELSKQLAEAAPQLDVQNYISLIRSAGRDKDVGRAFALLKKLEASEATVDAPIYNCVVDACVCAGDLQRARSLAQVMRQRFGSLDIVTYNTLVKGITAAGDVRGAWSMLKTMAEDGMKPNDITYNCIISACLATGDFRQAWEVIAAMEADGVKPDHYTMSTMLNALKRRGNPREAQRVLAFLDASGIDICSEEVLLNTVLEVCTQLGESRRLQELLTAHEQFKVKPSLHLYGALIKAANALKRIGKCRDLWKELTEVRGLEPNEIVLGCMMDALVCNRCTSEAVELFRRWRAILGLNSILLSTLVKGFAAEGRTDEAMGLWREARAEGTVLNVIVYNGLIDAQARAGRTDEVAVLFEGMQAEGLQGDAITYSTMVKSHCVKGDMGRALEVLSEMERRGLCRDSIVFNTILDWCTRQGRFSLADQILEKFENLKIAPTSFTVGILVKMYGRRRMLDRAFQVAQQLPEKWCFKATAAVYTCLMSACFMNNCPARALEVFRQMRGSGGADSKSYCVMIQGLSKAGMVQEAVELVEDAYGLNGRTRVLPSWSDLGAEVLEQLMRALAQKALADTLGKPLLAGLHAAGVHVDVRAFASAVESGPGRPRQPPPQQYSQRQQRGGGDRGRSERSSGYVRGGASTR